MNTGLPVLARTAKKVVYRAESLRSVTEELLHGLDWPEDSDGTVVFVFKEQVEDEYALIERNLSDKYFARFIYAAAKRDIRVPAAPAAAEISHHKFKDLEELKALFLGTNKIFSEAWKKQLKDRYASLLESQANEDLPGARVLSFEKAGKVVSLFTMTKETGYEGAPVDWLHWAWISDALGSQERSDIHRQAAEWVRANVEKEIQCNIFAFNLRSQKFFRKLGFLPKCLYIVRER